MSKRKAWWMLVKLIGVLVLALGCAWGCTAMGEPELAIVTLVLANFAGVIVMHESPSTKDR